jgi:hypothetical protein
LNGVNVQRVDSGAVTESSQPEQPPSQSVTDERLPVTPGSSMRYTLSHVANYLRGDMYRRRTAEETQQFLQALADEALRTGVDRILIAVHASRPVFRVQKLGLPELFETAASRPTHRIATVSDSFECRLAQQYVVTLARQRGLNARSFSSEAEAVAWLQAK